MAYGGPWLLDQLQQRLGIGAILAGRLARTRRDACTERVLFALVAPRHSLRSGVARRGYLL